jgi:hypothetical protein
MRSAPSVIYPVGRCLFYAGLLSVLGCVSLMLWVLVRPQSYLELVVLGAMLWMMWATLAAISWWRTPTGRLQWNASAADPSVHAPSAGAWSWHSSAYRDGVTLLRVERVQDFQRWMLLRLHNPDGAATWVWVERMRDPPRWDDLRRAVLAHG